MHALLASPLGVVTGLSIGALGGGGSVLAVPVLVYVAGQDARSATASSLVLVALTALVGIVPHARAGRVRFGSGLMFGLVGVAGAVAGSRLNAAVDPDVLLLAFSGFMLAAAILMIRAARRRPARADGAAVIETQSRRMLSALDGRTSARVLLAGTGVGLLTGFLGVGGGFVVVPALVLVLGFSMTDAIGTSIVVILINSLVSLGMRLDQGGIDWAVIAPFALSSIAGVVVGSRLAGRHHPTRLQHWFAALLVAVATYIAIRAGLDLAG